MGFILGMAPQIKLLLIMLLIAINLLFTFMVRRHLEKYYRKNNSVPDTLERLRKLNQYLGLFVLLATVIAVSFLMAALISVPNAIGAPVWWKIGPLLPVLVPFILLIIISLAQQFIMHGFIKELRGTAATCKEESGLLIRHLLIMFIPMILYMSFIFLMPDSFHEIIFYSDYTTIIFICFFLVLINMGFPYFYQKMIKAEPLIKGELAEALNGLLDQAGIKRARIYTWPTQKNKIGNALVAGLVHKKIFISDYLLANLTLEENQAILAHELGHVKKHHLWLRVGLMVLWVPLVSLTGVIASLLPDYSLSWLVYLPLYFLYFGFVILFFTRIQERQADKFALELGLTPETVISALSKLAQLNHMKMEQGKADEKFQTHPSMARRIKYLMKTANISQQQLNSLREKSQVTSEEQTD